MELEVVVMEVGVMEPEKKKRRGGFINYGHVDN